MKSKLWLGILGMLLLVGATTAIIYKDKEAAIAAYNEEMLNREEVVQEIMATIIFTGDKVCTMSSPDDGFVDCRICYRFEDESNGPSDCVFVPSDTTEKQDVEQVSERVRNMLTVVIPPPTIEYVEREMEGLKVVVTNDE